MSDDSSAAAVHLSRADAATAARPARLQRTRALEHYIFSTIAVLFAAVVLAGFARTYYLRGFLAAPLPSWHVHMHGLLGKDAFGEELADVIRLLPRYGVTAFLAATVTMPMESVLTRLQAMRQVLEHPPAGATCLGIHVEGNFLSPMRTGMANPDWCQALEPRIFDTLQEASGGAIRMITFAPEAGDAMEMIPYLLQLPLLIRILLALIGLDILTGVLAGFVTKSLNARTMFQGMGKKAMILTMVAACHLLSRMATIDENFDIHLGSLVATFYCLYEMLSIVENAQRCGIPLPAGERGDDEEYAKAESAAPRCAPTSASIVHAYGRSLA